MAKQEFQKTMKALDELNRDIDRLLRDLKVLRKHLGGELGALLEAQVGEALYEARRRLGPFAELRNRLQATVGGTLRPKAAGGATTGRKAAAKGGRKATAAAKKGSAKKAAGKKGGKGKRSGTKVNLSAAEIRAALDATGGVKNKAAASLGVSVPTFNKYSRQTGVA